MVLLLQISLEYSINSKSNWVALSTDGVDSISFIVPANGKAYVKGDNSTFSSSYSNYYAFSFSQQCSIGGNIMSLVGERETLDAYMFCRLFYQNANLVDASQLVLPATTLANNCYDGMFFGCTSLVYAPELPATTLADYCYGYMFYGCTSLVSAPALPATTLVDNCYEGMFQGCTSLVAAPELPATTLNDRCYRCMFQGCTSLVAAPELPATTLADYCYGYMFYGCISLTTAPALPATTLVDNCYYYMFYGCTNLSYIKAMFLTEPSTSYTNNWLSGIASSGTFVKNAAATWNVTGANGIPSGWTVETAAA